MSETSQIEFHAPAIKTVQSKLGLHCGRRKLKLHEAEAYGVYFSRKREEKQKRTEMRGKAYGDLVSEAVQPKLTPTGLSVHQTETL